VTPSGMRFVFSPPASAAAGLLTLPWREPLEEWRDDRLVEIRQRGLSRHVVRFVAEGGVVYALKELHERLARKEYHLLRRLREVGVPAVEVLGVVVDRPDDLDAVLVTRFLDYSSSYRALFVSPRGADLTGRLLDALVELLVRLHLAGFMWGDCSLSNVLFRMDAGAFTAYLVDAETSEMHPSLSDGQRRLDLDITAERLAGDLLDLQAGELLPEGPDPFAVADEAIRRYEALWSELTHEEILLPSQQRYRIAERLRRINELGFDVEEVELVEAGEGSRLRLTTRVAEPGDHRRLLFARTGLDVGENQARRLLNDIAAFHSYLVRVRGMPVPDVVAATQWLAEVYEPVVRAIPPALRGRLSGAEIFHEVLEHRWLLSEAAGRDIGTSAAASDYFATILPQVPAELTVVPSPPPVRFGGGGAAGGRVTDGLADGLGS
jgi:hypothetical protein